MNFVQIAESEKRQHDETTDVSQFHTLTHSIGGDDMARIMQAEEENLPSLLSVTRKSFTIDLRFENLGLTLRYDGRARQLLGHTNSLFSVF